MSLFYVERQVWQHWPKALIMCKKLGEGRVDRKRYIPDKGACKYDETEIIPVIRIFAKDTFANDPLGDRIHVLECTACGGTYEHVNGDYEFCPRCGRKCEGEYA